jgi:hypothetical protein
MCFNKLKYNEKITIAKLFFQENFYKGSDINFIPKQIFMNFNKFEFYTKAGDIQVKVAEVENFFNANGRIIRKEKLLQIRKNLS